MARRVPIVHESSTVWIQTVRIFTICQDWDSNCTGVNDSSCLKSTDDRLRWVWVGNMGWCVAG